MLITGVQTNLFGNQPLGPVTFQCYQPNEKFTSPHKNFINFQVLYASVHEYKKCNITTMCQDMGSVHSVPSVWVSAVSWTGVQTNLFGNQPCCY